MPDSAAGIWEATLKQLRSCLGEESFNTWFSRTKLAAFQESNMVIQVPSSFYKKWISANYLETIKGIVDQLTGGNIVISLKLPDRASSPQDDIPDMFIEQSLFESASNSEKAKIKEANLNPKYVFESFVVGESNNFAHAVAVVVAEPLSRDYNPMFIYGGVGLGKTHLMQAIGHRYIEKSNGSKVVYVTSEQFMNDFIDAITKKNLFEFRNYYRSIDLLLIDDVQFFIGKERTQTQFFHTFNALYDAGKKIAVSSDRPPKELAPLEERLRSRFEWGIIVDIQPPDLETRIAILKKKAELEGVDLPNDVAIYIAERIVSNIRELEGALLKLKAYTALKRRRIDVKTTRQLISHLIKKEPASPRQASIEAVQLAVCEYFDIRLIDLLGNSRVKKHTQPRHIAQYLARKFTPLSLPEIGEKFGGKDHTSVLHACRKIEKEHNVDEHLKNIINYLTKRIKEGS